MPLLFGNTASAGIQIDPILGSGSLGTQTVSTTPNTYFYLSSGVSAGSTSITVSDSTGLSRNDELMLHQTQYGAGVTQAGKFEFVRVSSVSGNTVSLQSALVNTYYSGTANSTSSSVTQAVKVPNYRDVTFSGTVSPSAWNGTTGGILVVKATGTISIPNSVVVSANLTGYRAGTQAGTAGSAIAFSGESWSGIGTKTQQANNGGSGSGNQGAGGQMWPSAGGGAGHAIAGTNGTSGGTAANATGACTDMALYGGRGGSSYGVTDLSRIYFGSGAGGGGGEGSCAGHSGGVGKTGAGAIILIGNVINVGGVVYANGENGDSVARAVAGGAAGGSLFFKAKTSFTNTGTIQLNGGTGQTGNYGPVTGTPSSGDGLAGNGSYGIAAVYSPSRTLGSFSVAPFTSSTVAA
jgi:hypothetical protein